MSQFPFSLFKHIGATFWLICANVFFFFLFSFLIRLGILDIGMIEAQPRALLGGEHLWTIITSMFMHQSFFHLFVNMFTLFFLGAFCERIIGKRRFLSLYFISGVVAVAFFAIGAGIGSSLPRGDWIFGGLDTYAAGASGALFGLLGVMAVLIPRHKIYLVAGPLLVFIAQVLVDELYPVPFVQFLLNILLLGMLVSMFTFNARWQRYALPLALPLAWAPVVAIVPLVIISFFFPLPIGNTAHFGGLVVGLLYGFILRLYYPNKIALLRKFFK
ncbi:rhomboid family intramembrane serine protease [Candidatus Pacearchaeota archaeon]|nr:rhomboid family intramembrane serine protease [Candidatus Pacearchaeota archaeon]